MKGNHNLLIIAVMGITLFAGLFLWLESQQQPDYDLIITGYKQYEDGSITIDSYDHRIHYGGAKGFDASQIIRLGEAHRLTFTGRTLTGITMMEK